MTTISSSSGLPPPVVPDRPATPVATAVPSQSAASVAVEVNTVQASPQPQAQSSALVDNAELQRVSDDLQRKVNGVTSELQFSVDDATGRQLVKVTDRSTKEVIRQIPSEEVLQINKGLDRYQQGLLVNRKA